MARNPAHLVVPFVLVVPPDRHGRDLAGLGRRTDGAEVAGGALLLAGVLVANRAKRARDRAPLQPVEAPA